jgi:YHYH protein
MGSVHLEALKWWEFDSMSLRYQRPLQPSIVCTTQARSGMALALIENIREMQMVKQKRKTLSLTFIVLFVSLTMAGCNSPDPKKTTANSSTTDAAEIDISLFGKDALVKDPVVVDCTLTTGEASKCAQLTVKHKPDNLQVGPFCPTTVNDTGGIWNWDGKEAGLYRVNGKFLRMLNSLGYKFYDAAGKVYISTSTATKPKFDNTCMSMKADTAVEMTILLPMTPKMADKPTDLGTIAKVGLALDGVPIFADAPSVLKTGHMPALDTCGGHIDPGGWYHWHATPTDINSVYDQKKVAAKCALQQSPSAQFAYAFDGYAMYGTTDMDGKVPTDLDACNGHIGTTARNPEGEYHYHATSDFPNLPKCLKGVQAKDNFSTTASTGLGSAGGGGGPGGPGGGPDGGPGPGGKPNFANAAKKLGVTEQALEQAIQDAGGPQADLADVAKTLKVSEDALKRALPARSPKP